MLPVETTRPHATSAPDGEVPATAEIGWLADVNTTRAAAAGCASAAAASSAAAARTPTGLRTSAARTGASGRRNGI